jgi:hypothetical protein
MASLLAEKLGPGARKGANIWRASAEPGQDSGGANIWTVPVIHTWTDGHGQAAALLFYRFVAQ